MNKYEKLIEYIVNDEQDKARALFHDIVVEKSRGIYESLMDEEQYDEGMGGNAVEDMVDEVSADEEGMQEAEDDMDDMDGDEIGTNDDDMGDMPDMGGDEEGEGDLEDRVMDLESALDELKAEFDAMMADEGGDDMGGMDDMDMGSDDDEDMMKNSMFEADEDKEEKEDDEEDEEDMSESRRNMSAADQIREYVEKVSDGHGAEKKGGAEGHEVGKGGSVSVNKNHIVAGKNDMGGTAANIVKGGSEQAPDGTSPKGKVGGFVKKGPDLIGDVENRVNSKTKGYTNKQSASKGEEGGVNKTSIESGGK
jgi:hypothetical protein